VFIITFEFYNLKSINHIKYFLPIVLIGVLLAFSSSQSHIKSCLDDNRRTDTLIINSGYDHSRATTFASGQNDNFWILTQSPDSTQELPRKPFVVGKYSAWSQPFSASSWISPYYPETFKAQTNNENQPYRFEQAVLCCQPTDTLIIELSIRSDNSSKIWFNDILLDSIGGVGNFASAPLVIRKVIAVNSSENYLKIDLVNQFTQLGINVSGRIISKSGTKNLIKNIYVQPSLTVYIPHIIADVGRDNFPIPINIKVLSRNMIFSKSAISTNVKLNATAFFPTGMNNSVLIENKVDNFLNRTLSIQIDSLKLKNSDTSLADILGTVLLGDSLTPIIFENFSISDPSIEIDNIIDGILTLQGCAIKYSRIQSFSPPDFSISPNPASEDITLKTSGDANEPYKLEIFNSQGLLMESFYWQNKMYLNKEIKPDMTKYPSGIYSAVLKTQWYIIKQQFVIIK
jgi:hypothetical protein